MVYVFYNRHCEERIVSTFFNVLLQQLPSFIQKDVLKYQRWEDRQRSLVGKHLLLKGLQLFKPASYSLQNLKYSPLQRPYLDDIIDFNISHAKDFSICAISQTEKVGIDIEKIQPIDISLYKDQFSEFELNQINRATNKLHAFYNLWTQKEAFLKAIGAGLNGPLAEVAFKNNSLHYNGYEWFMHPIQLHEDYSCHLCLNTSLFSIAIKEISFAIEEHTKS